MCAPTISLCRGFVCLNHFSGTSPSTRSAAARVRARATALSNRRPILCQLTPDPGPRDTLSRQPMPDPTNRRPIQNGKSDRREVLLGLVEREALPKSKGIRGLSLSLSRPNTLTLSISHSLSLSFSLSGTLVLARESLWA